MPDMLNALTALLPNCQVVFGSAVQSTAAGSSSTVTLTNLSGTVDFDQTQVTITRNSIGNYSIAVTNFRGPSGTVIGLVTITTTGLGYLAWTNAATYGANTDTATVVFQTTTTNVADCGFNFAMLAY